MKTQTAMTILILAIALAFGGVAQGSITINPAGPVTITVGQTVDLEATYAVSQNVTWYEWLLDGTLIAGTNKKITEDGDDNTQESGGTTSYVFDSTGRDPGTYVVGFHIWHHERGRDAYEYVTIIVTEPVEGEWYGETAWADGEPYTTDGGGNWATYTPYDELELTVTLYAGQSMDAGTVHFSAPDGGEVTITITLNSGWRFLDAPGNVKIQDYASAPSGNPAPGQFVHKGDADPADDSFEITVPLNNFYGVHVDVEHYVAG